ncbi:MAG TPA: hypothetical protein VNC59_05220, partial [Thermoanaerobaculia bacterium]|nr:hypothetical protein [Thermoanaerobaculia bacterium]
DKRVFRAAVSEIPDDKAVVFVRYAAGHNPHSELIANEPNLEKARVWIVYDRGKENAQILKLARERMPYVYVEARKRLQRLDRVTLSGEE